ncbi:MAG TPA: S46 family peptidase, partial [Isosphaeraceae bacterium]
PELEIAKLAHGFEFWKKVLPDDTILLDILHGRTPEETARALVTETKVGDVAVRKQLAQADLDTLKSSHDPMIKLALIVDARARAARKVREEQVEGVQTAQYARIAQAIFADRGTSVYPDATFTLRLAFGQVKGIDLDGKIVPAYTTMGGAFEHAEKHGSKPPYELPQSWIKAKAEHRFRLDTPLNFISTADIIGGNSGSPVVNRENEVVGLIFDGNIDSLILDFAYDDRAARSVSVDSRAIETALRTIYGAEALANELTGR